MALYESEDFDGGLKLARQIAQYRSRMFIESSPQVIDALGFVAAGLALQGNDAGARRTFGSTLAQMRPAEVPIAHEYQRYSTEIYLRILARGTTEDVAEAFKVADALHVASTDRAVSASVARARLPSSDLADLARHEQDAQQQINAREELLANGLSQTLELQDSAALATLRGEIDKLKRARDVLVQEIGKRFPNYANLASPLPATIEQARAVLTRDEALVVLYSGEKESYVWALRKTGDPAFAVIPLRRDQLAARVDRLRGALDLDARTLGEIPAFDVDLAYQLYAAILQPVAAGWKGARTLVTVPHGPLAQLPLRCS